MLCVWCLGPFFMKGVGGVLSMDGGGTVKNSPDVLVGPNMST